MIDESGRKQVFRLVAADTIAMLVYTMLGGALTLLYEVAIAGLTLHQWAGIRIVKSLLRYGGARFCGRLTDWMRLRIRGKSQSRLRKMFADSLTLALYQLTINVLGSLCMGATCRQIAVTSGFYFLDNMLFGWIYGIILDFVRKRSGWGLKRA